MDGRIIATVSDQPHACGHGIQIRQGHVPRREHPAVAVDKGDNRSNQVTVWNAGGDGDDWQNRDITPELEHRKSGYVERKRRPYQGNVVRIA